MANKMKKEELLQSYLFILPAAIILLVFFLFPIGYAFVLSFLKLNSKFAVKAVVGAQNYTDVLSDRKLIAAFFNTLKYVAIVVPIQTFLAMLIASVLNSNIKGKNTFRIHGTLNEKTIGTNESAGCIRMKNGEVLQLATLLNQFANLKSLNDIKVILK